MELLQKLLLEKARKEKKLSRLPKLDAYWNHN